MYLFSTFAPHPIMGRRLLTEDEIINYLINKTIYYTTDFSNSYETQFVEQLAKFKQKLNSKYSYLKRFDFPNEVNKMYNAYVRTQKKEQQRIIKLNKMSKLNIRRISLYAKSIGDYTRHARIALRMPSIKSKNMWTEWKIQQLRYEIDSLKISIRDTEKEAIRIESLVSRLKSKFK